VLCLDSTLALTRGNPLGPLALLSLLHPAKGSYIAVVDVDGGKDKMIGQVVHLTGQRSAHLAFMLPEGNTDANGRVALLEALAREAGEMGALSVVAELEDCNPMVENLRRSGFSIFCWQRIWKLPGGSTSESPLWQEAKPEDEFAIRSLFHAVAPPMVQSAETPPPQRAGLAFKQNGNLLAYVEAISGPLGVCLLPLFHPDTTEAPALLGELADMMNALNRPVHLIVRSYQSWLEGSLENMGAMASPRQAVMVRHLARLQRVEEYVPSAVVERRTIEPSASVRNNITLEPSLDQEGKPLPTCMPENDAFPLK
jgi:hypothetical protein